MTCFSLGLQADVFWRRPADLPGTWQRAYTSPFSSQGHEGTVTVYGTQDGLNQIGAALRDRHGESLVWMPGEQMAWAIAMQNNRLIRYLIQPTLNGDYWIAAFESDARTAPPPGTKPPQHQLRDLPAPLGGIPSFYSYDAGNQTAVEISEVAASPEGALISMSQQLESAGWAPSPINTGGFRMFAKGNEVAFLGAHQGKDGITRLLRLHKPLGVK
jgi:hypothetical protein